MECSGSVLYVNVKQPASGAKYIGMYFDTTPNTFGTFGFQGDGVIWSTPTINRPNTGAFLICPDPTEGALLYINLGEVFFLHCCFKLLTTVYEQKGNYAYQTPSGCYDSTVN